MVRKRLKRAGRALLFLALGVLLFASLQRVLTQKYKFGAGLTLKGFYGLPDDSVDVLCLGTSHVYEGLSALDLYDLSGNRTYLLSSAGQPIEISRYMLEWALQTQHPQIVIFDVSAFFHDGDNACWRCVLDSMTLRAEKLQLACAYHALPADDCRSHCALQRRGAGNPSKGDKLGSHVQWTEAVYDWLFKEGSDCQYYGCRC